jgi:hypothetical protein
VQGQLSLISEVFQHQVSSIIYYSWTTLALVILTNSKYFASEPDIRSCCRGIFIWIKFPMGWKLELLQVFLLSEIIVQGPQQAGVEKSCEVWACHQAMLLHKPLLSIHVDLKLHQSCVILHKKGCFSCAGKEKYLEQLILQVSARILIFDGFQSTLPWMCAHTARKGIVVSSMETVPKTVHFGVFSRRVSVNDCCSDEKFFELVQCSSLKVQHLQLKLEHTT